MKLRPLRDRILVRRVAEKARTAGGIIIPDTAKENPMEGEILAIGAGIRNEKGDVVPLDVEVGDRVLFGRFAGTEVRMEGEKLLIMNESDIMAVIQDAGTDQARDAA